MRGGGNWLPLYAILMALILLIKGSEYLVAFWRRRLKQRHHRKDFFRDNGLAAETDFSSN